MSVTLSPTISLAGSALASSWQGALLEVHAELVLSRPARLVLRFADPGYSLLSKNTVALGMQVSLTVPGASSPLLTGEVTEVGCEQREGEQPELIVVAHDQSHRLARMSNVGTYLSMGVNDVVTSLAQAAGLTPSVSGSLTTIDYLMQVDTNLGLLDELAARTGCDWWVEGSDLHFAPPASVRTIQLTLGKTLRSFSARATGYHADKVVVDGWNRDEQEVVTGTASSASTAVLSTSPLAKLVESPGTAFGDASIVTSSIGANTQEEAATLSQVLLDRQAASSVEAWGVADGTVALALTDIVEVGGAGPLNGKYPVTSIDFSYRPHRGSLLRFRCGDRRRSPAMGLGGRGSENHGSVVSHPGLIVGLVTNINDPNKQGRVKVRFPGLSSKDESAWARLTGIGGGNNRGSVFVPEVNDEVLVAFEGGDTRLPVVIGGLYGSKSVIPTPDIDNGQVQSRQLQSRLGHYFRFLDGTSSANQAIELALSGGQNLIHLGKDKLTLQVPSNTPVDVIAGNSTISVAASGAITMKAPSISIQAQTSLELKAATISVAASSALSLQADAATTLKGSTVQVQSSGAMTIVGASVAIN
ncbi:phage baseplate assembly protein V [Ferrimicrobium acidiphilum]|uniref:phage baseplate assembly protein V n=1 Tax=Ferrimicrobium acidiphilum TaxID=121039 RepID=UPI0023F3ADEE|nr:phage baseplate assembly protein V [Ferrimicrobium acidiphilum]